MLPTLNTILRHPAPCFHRPILFGHPARKISHQPSNTANKNYAILIGGGSSGRTITRLWRENLATRAEFKDVQVIDLALKKSGHYDPNNISIFFGNGSNSQRVTVWESFLRRCISKWRGYPLVKEMSPLANLTGPANVKSIESEFQRIAKIIKPHDSLSIFISGHGRKFGGTILWNEYWGFEVITIKNLSKFLSLLPNNVSVYLMISSCYSGHFLPLSSRNVTVICSSNAVKVSRYFDSKGCAGINQFSQNLITRKISLLRSHAQGSVDQYNYHALDSLSFFIKKEFEKHLGTSVVRDAFQQMMIGINTRFWGPISVEMAFIALLLADPSGLSRIYVDTKVAMALGKLSVPLLKLGAFFLIKKQYEIFKESIVKTAWYRERHVRQDKKDIIRMASIIQNLKASNFYLSESELQNFYTDRKKFLDSNRREIELVLKDLLEMKQERSKDETMSSYFYLHDKAELFLSYGTKSQLEVFLAIATKMTAKPFSLRPHIHPQEMAKI